MTVTHCCICNVIACVASGRLSKLWILVDIRALSLSRCLLYQVECLTRHWHGSWSFTGRIFWNCSDLGVGSLSHPASYLILITVCQLLFVGLILLLISIFTQWYFPEVIGPDCWPLSISTRMTHLLPCSCSGPHQPTPRVLVDACVSVGYEGIAKEFESLTTTQKIRRSRSIIKILQFTLLCCFCEAAYRLWEIYWRSWSEHLLPAALQRTKPPPSRAHRLLKPLRSKVWSPVHFTLWLRWICIFVLFFNQVPQTLPCPVLTAPWGICG